MNEIVILQKNELEAFGDETLRNVDKYKSQLSENPKIATALLAVVIMVVFFVVGSMI